MTKESIETYRRRKFYQQQLTKLRECHFKMGGDPFCVNEGILTSADVWEKLRKNCEAEKRDYNWLMYTWDIDYIEAFVEEDFGKMMELELEFYKFWGCPISKETLNPKEFLQW